MQKWYFNGVDLCTKAWYVETLLQGAGTTGLRGDDIQMPTKDGKFSIKKQYNSRTITLGMWVTGFDSKTGLVPTGKTMEQQLLANIDYLCTIFGRRYTGTLLRVFPDGAVRKATVECKSEVSFAYKPEGYAKFTVDFDMADPFFYSLIAAVNTYPISASPTSIVHTNTGNSPVKKIKITLTGPLSSPYIESLTNGVWLEYQGVINTGETVVIDCEDYTCYKDTTNMIAGIRHGGDYSWFIVEPGVNNLVVTSSSTGGSVKIEYYPAYF